VSPEGGEKEEEFSFFGWRKFCFKLLGFICLVGRYWEMRKCDGDRGRVKHLKISKMDGGVTCS
jgi:hypothetical protein